MKLRIISWNVRGANDSSKRRRLGLCGRDSGVLGQKVFGGDGDGGRKVLSLLGDQRLVGRSLVLREDFNVILSQRERSRQGRLSGAMRSFAQIVDDLELIDLPMQGVDGFIDLLRGWWQGIEGGVWKAGSQQKFCLQQLEYWDGVESERTLTSAKAEQKKQAKDAFHHWVLLEEVHWRQKSRELWLKERDRNTGYFHRMANAHRRNNSMDRIMINGELLTEDQSEGRDSE
ncbi:hypothetical protein CK203_090922 [Vitis vinifera]|uniref:Uncharacterized protein n=1 Tax=Vitis vinifera TaxID=29760 RepID=A0A438DRW1_VITVI|nr:hypothetical protein CK203_090922 [Vitis vinifera]